MKIGNKIRRIRELKSITPKDMADRLNITPQSYNKIEREEVTINMDRLLELSEIFGMKPEDLLTFDEKQIFNTYDNSVGINNGTLNHFPQELKTLLEKQIKLLEEQTQYLKEQNQFLHERLKYWEGK
jgi:transcriptional regulator with XRE-family HTH domain